MKITKSQLKQIIKEELEESVFGPNPGREEEPPAMSRSGREHATGPDAAKKHAELILALLENLRDDIDRFSEKRDRKIRFLPGFKDAMGGLIVWIKELENLEKF